MAKKTKKPVNKIGGGNIFMLVAASLLAVALIFLWVVAGIAHESWTGHTYHEHDDNCYQSTKVDEELPPEENTEDNLEAPEAATYSDEDGEPVDEEISTDNEEDNKNDSETPNESEDNTGSENENDPVDIETPVEDPENPTEEPGNTTEDNNNSSEKENESENVGDDIKDQEEHEHNFIEKIVNATHTKAGGIYSYCECGEENLIKEIPVISEHIWGNDHKCTVDECSELEPTLCEYGELNWAEKITKVSFDLLNSESIFRDLSFIQYLLILTIFDAVMLTIFIAVVAKRAKILKYRKEHEYVGNIGGRHTNTRTDLTPKMPDKKKGRGRKKVEITTTTTQTTTVHNGPIRRTRR